MTYVGIDPGKKGAIAMITTGVGVSVYPTPIVGGEYDIREMDRLVESCKEFDNEVHCCIERVHAMPGQGRTSMLSIGYGAGLWHALLACYEIPYSIVSAVSWQREVLAGMPKMKRDERKKQCVIVAKRLFPEVCLRKSHYCTVDSDGMADALLLAHFARLMWTRL